MNEVLLNDIISGNKYYIEYWARIGKRGGIHHSNPYVLIKKKIGKIYEHEDGRLSLEDAYQINIDGKKIKLENNPRIEVKPRFFPITTFERAEQERKELDYFIKFFEYNDDYLDDIKNKKQGKKIPSLQTLVYRELSTGDLDKARNYGNLIDMYKPGKLGGKKKKTNKTKKFKKHFMWNTKGKRYIAKTRKQHLKGVKYGHTHKKPKTQKRVKRGSGNGDYEKKKRIYTAYKLIPGKRYDIIVKRKIDGEMYKIPQIFKDVAFDSFYTRPMRSSMRRISPRRNKSSGTDDPTLEIAKFKYNEDKNSLVYISFDSLNEFYELESLGDQLKKSKEVNALIALDKSTRGIEDLKREIAKYGGKN